MTKQATKGIVLKYMKDCILNCDPSFGSLLVEIIKKLMDAELCDPIPKDSHTDHLNYINSNNPHLESILNECYMYLLLHGIIIPKPDSYQFGTSTAWQYYELTEYGKSWASSKGEPIPEDTLGFLDYLTNTIPNLDEIIIQYVNEALNTFNSDYFFASAVMLGAASEKLIYLLSEAIIGIQIPDRIKKSIVDALKFTSLKQLNDNIVKGIEYLINQKKIDYDIYEGSHHYLGSLFDAIRIQRNEAVHPVAGKVTQEQVRLLLLSFPHVCKKSYDLLNWFKKNQIKKE